MKKLFTILAVVLINASSFAQSPPQKMSYQAIIRNSNNALVTSTTVGMQITILQASPMGVTTPVYVETQTPTTNINGLVSIEVGAGTVVSGIFSAISWAYGPFYIKTETDLAGGTNYSITGTSQLLSVPYALFSANGTPTGTYVGEMLYWDGSHWFAVALGITGQTLTFCHGVPTWGPCPLVIGDNYQGGIIFYIFQSGDTGYVVGETHGLIAAPGDQSATQGWGCPSTAISGADGTAIGTGNQNTIDIVAGCSTVNIAASVCANLVLNGYSDWFLPSKNELLLMYTNLKANNLGSFTSSFYWSSSEYDATHAWYCNFGWGAIGYNEITKDPICAVRPARSF